ncbi:hypothetical protein PENSUB_866 [Penicillium subrubescens]|uniref:Uncharacterized protein n=1 Tax=Penicillium subrubescens TaxID=1316194 RepID=A0A1Q5UMF8_9EURO|nr:hypothetical protein PENSUB_866 [Penicillium subrubescens]
MIDVTLEATLLKSSVFVKVRLEMALDSRSICLCTWWLAEGAEQCRDTNHETRTESTKQLITAMEVMAMKAVQPSQQSITD